MHKMYGILCMPVYIVVSCKGAGDYIASIDGCMFVHVPSSFIMCVHTHVYMYSHALFPPLQKKDLHVQDQPLLTFTWTKIHQSTPFGQHPGSCDATGLVKLVTSTTCSLVPRPHPFRSMSAFNTRIRKLK